MSNVPGWLAHEVFKFKQLNIFQNNTERDFSNDKIFLKIYCQGSYQSRQTGCFDRLEGCIEGSSRSRLKTIRTCSNIAINKLAALKNPIANRVTSPTVPTSDGAWEYRRYLFSRTAAWLGGWLGGELGQEEADASVRKRIDAKCRTRARRLSPALLTSALAPRPSRAGSESAGSSNSRGRQKRNSRAVTSW